ncbi:efflux RND transporter permease subunit [Exilibacterium tricleocarpae]|uniref:Efflux RND transporter permease subunit n=1 Tax=Exilibacterium tricleocarpae TaxID=2591008 RepID=A0A545T0K9_9GAMM|nr:efflux RND transporter permease subunit [Exilibacterium tricleocarpae]TQV70719.1 efflux RND transporter permease subunit [Exilibacterium tricleocarpae]
MNLAEFTIRNKVLSVIVILLTAMGGWSAYQHMPRFEDPEFTIRQALVITRYPGASPLEVAEEVSEPLERAIQQMQEVKKIESVSAAGVSEITVEIKYEFSPSKADLQLIWTKLRNKVTDAQQSLPPGAETSIVNDDFGDVYGIYYLITGAGYTPAELRRYAKQLQSELLQVDGVGKVSLGGELQEAIFVEISRENAAALGVSISSIYDTLAQQNAVVAAGDVIIDDRRIIIDPSGAIDSVAAIQNLLVSTSEQGRITYLRDIAHVWRGYQTPPQKLFRFNRQPAIALGVAGVLGSNIAKIGRAVDMKIADSVSRRPVGIEVQEYYHQGKVVDASVQDFLLNVIAALVIVIVTLFLFMGLKSAIVIGGILLLTIFATLATMNLVNIPMHRISLGALIIALGMMVDNAIVVTEGILVGVKRGLDKLDIAKKIVSQTQWPLLGGTLVGIIAFAPIGFAPGDTAEYTGHLFWVVLISLLYSWVFAVTLTPLFCYWLFKAPPEATGDAQADNAFYRSYKGLLRGALNRRVVTVAVVVGVFLASLWGFQFVKSGFFPTSTTPQIVVDFWLPEGTDIHRTQQDIERVEDFVGQLDGINTIKTSVGGGGLRYMLVYPPESPNGAYAQILARVDDYRQIDKLMPQIQSHIDDNYPDAQAKVWRFVLGPGGGSKIEATFKGPNPKVLRQLAEQAKAIMIKDGGALSIKDNWRQPVSVIEPVYSETSGRRAGVSREDLAAALQTNFSGRSVGVYREDNDLLPIIARAPAAERVGVSDIENVQVLSSSTGKTVPIGQVTDGFKTIWRDGRLRREDRVWTIKAQSDPYPDELASQLHGRIRPAIEAIPLPDGYTLEWDGEYGDSKEANDNLASTLPLGLLAMVLIVFVLFGKVRQPLVIWLVVPLALIGVVVGLVITQFPLEFMGILGILSLSGLLIKNAIVLVDQTDLEINEGKPRYQAVVEAAASRVRPVMMGALTTVLGVVPLFFDAFFQSMAVVLVFGLSFATALTLVVVPVLYAIFFNIRAGEAPGRTALS